jgi:peptide/nickel transport system permease protein
MTKKDSKKITVIDNPNEAEILSSADYSFFSMLWSRFRRHKLAIVGLILMTMMIILAIIAPLFDIITGYPEKHTGLDKKMPPFSRPGVTVNIKADDWQNPEKWKSEYGSGYKFWFTNDEDPTLTGYGEPNTNTLNNPKYREYYDFNLKPFGSIDLLQKEVVFDDITLEQEDKGYSEFFTGGYARIKRYNQTGEIITYAPPFEAPDTSLVKTTTGETPREDDLGPAPMHVLGTDGSGHDILVRLAWGARISLIIAISVVLLTAFIGIVLGALAGFNGAFVDALFMRVIELMYSIPMLPIYMVLSKFMGGSLLFLILIFTVTGWTGMARMTRNYFLSLKKQEYAEAARAIGASPARIMFKHLLPNSLTPIIVGMTLSIGGIIISESSLSFLGFGINPITTTTWGGMLYEANGYIMDQPWPAVFSGLMIFITVLASNFLGDGLRDALDPRMKV